MPDDEKLEKLPGGEEPLWDDGDLRSAIVDARAWMKERNIPERPEVDWRRIAREERVRRWRRNLRRGLAGLQERGGDSSAGVRAQVNALLHAPETLGAAALELVLGPGGWSVSPYPLPELVASGANFQVDANLGAERGRATLGPVSETDDLAILYSNGIPGARLKVDAAQHAVILEFLPGAAPLEGLALLVPERSGEPIRVGERTNAGYRLSDPPPGEYLFFFF